MLQKKNLEKGVKLKAIIDSGGKQVFIRRSINLKRVVGFILILIFLLLLLVIYIFKYVYRKSYFKDDEKKSAFNTDVIHDIVSIESNISKIYLALGGEKKLLLSLWKMGIIK